MLRPAGRVGRDKGGPLNSQEDSWGILFILLEGERGYSPQNGGAAQRAQVLGWRLASNDGEDPLIAGIATRMVPGLLSGRGGETDQPKPSWKGSASSDLMNCLSQGEGFYTERVKRPIFRNLSTRNTIKGRCPRRFVTKSNTHQQVLMHQYGTVPLSWHKEGGTSLWAGVAEPPRLGAK